MKKEANVEKYTEKNCQNLKKIFGRRKYKGKFIEND